ncbi:MAG: OmpA family protein, partial [Nitrospinota bacterium]
LETVKNRQIIIKGHTDNVPIGKKIKEEFPSNWELSALRAINVVHYLHKKVGISPKTLSATGYSKFRPVATNDTPEGRAQNRRIEITLLPLDVDKVLKELEN